MHSAWRIECSFQQAKGQTGLDHYQVRRYDAWYRHITLAMLANAFLAVMRATAAQRGRGRHRGPLSAQKWPSCYHSPSQRSVACWPRWCGGWQRIPVSCWPGQAGGGVTKPALVVATGNNANDAEKCGCSIRPRFVPLGLVWQDPAT